MDAKVTLSFDQTIIEQGKKFAEANNISLSRLTEFLLRKATSTQYSTLDDLPVSDWVSMVAEGRTEYQISPRSRSALKSEYRTGRSKK
ncbi:MAG: DUF6364 family protein [Cyclobacteriaceae bacterium]